MRKNIVAGNWKMNKNASEALDLVSSLSTLTLGGNCSTIVAPPFPFLSEVNNKLINSKIEVSAQNCSLHESGAYTGEVSASMIKSVGVNYVILGHSERREYFSETNEELAQKVDVALNNKLLPIFCCGEALEVREKNNQKEFVCNQLEESLFHLSDEDFSKIIIAYEPIWAIGTGVTASSGQAQEMHKDIRDFIASKYGKEIADNTSILYGGSCKPSNAKELFANPDVDGGLIGGASLKAEDFAAITNSF